MSKEYILCAAIWFDDGKPHVHQPVNIQSGFVVCGRRHHNCFATLTVIQEDKAERLELRKKSVQGFITSTDRFVDRKEAGSIAFNSAQAAFTDCLFSEDLY